MVPLPARPVGSAAPSPPTPHQRATLRLLGSLLVTVGWLLLALPAASAQPAGGSVLVVPVRDTIDLGLAPFLARALAEAQLDGARAVILEINTPGGRLDAVLQIRDTLLASPVRTIAYVNREAFSAGALIALAANEIYFAPGAVMGAATPVDAAGAAGDEKVISAVRKTFKATAELRGRDPRVAEAMVDPAVEITGLVAADELLTLTTNEARTWGYADGIAANRQALLSAAGLQDAVIQELTPSLAEMVVRFLTQPAIAALIFAGGILLIIVDLFSGELGLLAVAGLALLALFFWGHFLTGLAGWEGVALVAIGLALLGVEVFLIPGFGIAGLLGLTALFGGLYLSITGREIVTPDDVERATATVAGAFVLLVAGAVVIVWLLPAASRFRGLVLKTAVAGAGDRRPIVATTSNSAVTPRANGAPDEHPSLIGATGRALSDLRPGGFALIDGQRVDVVTQGDYIPAGELVEIILDEGYRRVVRRLVSGPV